MRQFAPTAAVPHKRPYSIAYVEWPIEGTVSSLAANWVSNSNVWSMFTLQAGVSGTHDSDLL